ncbi:MAG: SRPBCC family protein [Solirubrobacteraceae bacterium]
MPTVRRSRTIAAPAGELWEVICDPHHLPRWWPRVTRVEDVDGEAFTEVMKTRKGRLVRADFRVAARDEAERTLTWEQLLQGTPFARVLQSAATQVWLAPAQAGAASQDGDASGEPPRGATVVSIELRQQMAGYSHSSGLFMGFSARFGSPMVRRAARATLDEALDGLERIGG